MPRPRGAGAGRSGCRVQRDRGLASGAVLTAYAVRGPGPSPGADIVRAVPRRPGEVMRRRTALGLCSPSWPAACGARPDPGSRTGPRPAPTTPSSWPRSTSPRAPSSASSTPRPSRAPVCPCGRAAARSPRARVARPRAGPGRRRARVPGDGPRLPRRRAAPAGRRGRDRGPPGRRLRRPRRAPARAGAGRGPEHAVVTEGTALVYDLRRTSDLADVASAFRFGGPPECPDRAFCLQGSSGVYDLQFEDFVPLDSGGPLSLDTLRRGDVDVVLLFSTDGNLARCETTSSCWRTTAVSNPPSSWCQRCAERRSSAMAAGWQMPSTACVASLDDGAAAGPQPVHQPRRRGPGRRRTALAPVPIDRPGSTVGEVDSVDAVDAAVQGPASLEVEVEGVSAAFGARPCSPT